VLDGLALEPELAFPLALPLGLVLAAGLEAM